MLATAASWPHLKDALLDCEFTLLLSVCLSVCLSVSWPRLRDAPLDCEFALLLSVFLSLRLSVCLSVYHDIT